MPLELRSTKNYPTHSNPEKSKSLEGWDNDIKLASKIGYKASFEDPPEAAKKYIECEKIKAMLQIAGIIKDL